MLEIKISRIIVIIILLIIFGCKTGQKNVIAVNDIKNRASDNTKTANSFVKSHNLDKALVFYQDALNLNLIADNVSGIIMNTSDIAKVYFLQGKYQQALDKYQEAFNLIEDERNYLKKAKNLYEREEAFLLNSLGEAYYLLDDYENAREFFLQAMNLEIHLGNEENQALISMNLAKILSSQDKFDEAVQELLIATAKLEALFDKNKLNNNKSLSLAYYTIAQNFSKDSKYNKAFEYLLKALTIDRQIENSSGIADDYYALGIVSEHSKEYEKALSFYKKCGKIYRILDYLDMYIKTTERIASVNLIMKDYEKYIDNNELLFSLSKNKNKEYISNILNILSDEEVIIKLTKEKVDYFIKKYNTFK